jgi:hypothetical protein
MKIRRKSGAQYHTLKQKYQTLEDLRTLRLAIENSNNIQTYNRYELHQIYRRVFIDPEFSAQWNTRVLKTQDKEFHIETIEGGVSKSHKELFTAPWFFKWIELALEYRMWGYSLIEFGPWEDNAFVPYMDTTGRYHTAVEVVDRDYVKPELGTIVPEYGDGIGAGVSYFNNRFSDRLMFIGGYDKTYDILYKSAPYMLMKENTLKNWSEWAEVFAMDMRVGKTQQQGSQRNEFIKMLRDMGSNGYAVIDEEDIIDYIGVNRQDAYKVYESFLEYVDARIAKLIFGQDVVTNNTGRVVGKVGEDVSNMYGDADAKFIEWTVNTHLLPFMSQHGAEVDGIRFKYDTTEKIKLTERAKVDKAISDMGWKISEEYLVRTYGVQVDEFTGVPFSGRENLDTSKNKDKDKDKE